MSPQIASYGSWKSPISSARVASSAMRFEMTTWDGEVLYWIENRPWEGGRSVIVQRRADGQTRDITPAPFNARSRVHEYGGGAMLAAGGTVYFTNFSDQRLYRVAADKRPESQPADPHPITPEGPWRYADAVMDGRCQRLICVREAHLISLPGSEPGHQQVLNTLVSIPLAGADTADQIQVLASGADFYSNPRISPDGKYLSWLAWDHPNMPWDGTQLWQAELGPEGLTNLQRIAGGQDESIYQPEWSPDGKLYFASDRRGWWNLYRWQRDSAQIEPVLEIDAEVGQPQWVFGRPVYGFATTTPNKHMLCCYSQGGTWHLGSIDLTNHKFTARECPYTEIEELRLSPDGKKAAMIASHDTQAAAIVVLDIATNNYQVLRQSLQLTVEPGFLSTPQAIEFPASPGAGDQQPVHAFYYPPQNKDYLAPALSDEKPPLLVISHGGPTSAASSSLSLKIQYWTSRGFAVLDVNYRGSSGYGRAYRQLLNGEWGIADMEDCVNGALYLVECGLADRQRLIIRGGSAGGYTTLCALTFREIFKAGASYYGIGDLEAMAKDTHKFESHYLDGLVGPFPQAQAVYQQRSPIHAIQRLSCPIIFFQGLDDRVVPPNQAEMMVAQLRRKGLPVAYIGYPGEGHGFRQAENIQHSLDAELYFYAKIFGFEIDYDMEPVQIENL